MMDCDKHREVLRSLSRRELQSRAKALGVRANGKTVDIIELVANVLSRPGSPSRQYDEQDDDAPGSRCRPADTNAKDQHVGPTAMDCSEGHTTQVPDNCLGGSCPRTAAPAPAAPHPMSPNDLATAPTAGSDTSAKALTATPGAHPQPVPTPSLADLAARASAAALAASLNNLRFESQLKATNTTKGAASMSLLRDGVQLHDEDGPCASPGAASPCQLKEPTPRALKPPGPQELSSENTSAAAGALSSPAQEMQPCLGEEPVRCLAFGHSVSPVNGGGANSAPCCAPEQGTGAAGASGTCAGRSSCGDASEQAGCSDDNDDGNDDVGDDDHDDRPQVAHQHMGGVGVGFRGKSSSSPTAQNSAEAPSRTPAARTPQLRVAAATVAATTPTLVPPHAGGGKATALLVTGRTPFRQQRLLGGHAMMPPSGAAAATPVGRIAGCGGGGGGAALQLPRTPGTGLRTPARRVPVCTDEAQARTMDEWVAQNLLRTDDGPAANGLSWRDFVGLDDVKERLQGAWFGLAAAAPDAPAASPAATTTSSSSPAAAAAQRVAMAASSAPCIGTSSYGAGGATTEARGARPAQVATRGGSGPAAGPPNAAVLLCGPPGMGKSQLARALAAEVGAAYVHVPADLPGRVASQGGGADAALRSVFRVAAQAAGPVIVHLEDVELLASSEAGRQSQECRRMRTELLVAVEELLLQGAGSCATSAAPAVVGARTPAQPAAGTQQPDGSSGGSSRRARTLKLLVLSTTSRPMDLDSALAATLGQTERLLLALPDAEAREAYLVGRLVSEGAALGVEQVEHFVRQTEGFGCSELAAICDRAVAAAAARQAMSQLGGGVSVVVEEMVAALQVVGRQVSSRAMAELQQWHTRMGAPQGRRGP